MRDFIQATLNAGLQIALALNARTPNLYAKHARGAGGDISIGADLLSEEIFITQLSAFGNIDSEEAGFVDNKKAHTIVIDPLDGSDNFLSQIPYYGASVALRENGAESRLDSASVGIIMNFCNLSAVVSFKGKNYYGNLAQDFSLFAESSPNSASCGDFLGSASARFVNEPKSSISSLASHNPKNSSTILEFASCKENAESTLDSANIAKCGIFEGAYRNPHICEILHKNNIKFRALGALALSLGLSERVNFVLFDGKKRHYDFEAGFLVAQNLHKIEAQNLVLISKDKILFDKISNLLF